MFYGCDFTFNGTACSDFGMVMYDFGNSKESGFELTSPAEYDSDDSRLGYRNKYYGQKQKNPLVLTLTFGVNEDRLGKGLNPKNPRWLQRREINDISVWLTGVRGYKILTIDQYDMQDYYYLCHCTGLELLDDGVFPCAFKATFTCDSPYAYAELSPTVYEFTPPLLQLGKFFVENPSPYAGFLYPTVHIDIGPADSVEASTWLGQTSTINIGITNGFDGEARNSINMSGLPRKQGRLTLNCQTCQMSFTPASSSDEGITPSALYGMSEGGFIRIYPIDSVSKAIADISENLAGSWGTGINEFITHSSNTDTKFIITVECNFPVDIGG